MGRRRIRGGRGGRGGVGEREGASQFCDDFGEELG